MTELEFERKIFALIKKRNTVLHLDADGRVLAALINELVQNEIRKERLKLKTVISMNSVSLVGIASKRHKALKRKQYDWSSFYNGWLEGRVDNLTRQLAVLNKTTLHHVLYPQSKKPRRDESIGVSEGYSVDVCVIGDKGSTIMAYYDFKFMHWTSLCGGTFPKGDWCWYYPVITDNDRKVFLKNNKKK